METKVIYTTFYFLLPKSLKNVQMRCAYNQPFSERPLYKVIQTAKKKANFVKNYLYIVVKEPAHVSLQLHAQHESNQSGLLLSPVYRT